MEHPGKSAEQAYEKMLANMSLTEGEVQDGKTVVKALLLRCLLWIEIVKEKYGHHISLSLVAAANPLFAP